MKKFLLLAVGSILAAGSFAQLVVEKGAGLYLGKGTEVSVAGDIDINETITGDGLLSLNGESDQRINAHGYAVPGIRIDNPGYVDLAGPLVVSRTLQMSNGKLKCNDFNLSLDAKASLEKSGSTSWIETNGRGAVRKAVNTDIENFLVPLGTGNVYTPAIITAKGINKQGAIAILSKDGTASSQPVGIKDYLNHHWQIDLSGVDGKVDVRAGYTNGTLVEGSESALSAFYRQKTAIRNEDAFLDRSNHIIHATVSGSGGEIFAMNPPNALQKLSLTPNPVRDYGMLRFYAEQAGRKEIVIIDESGRMVRKQVINVVAGPNQHSINMQGLAKGYYNLSTSGLDKTFLVLKK
jgi:hypothetical protein